MAFIRRTASRWRSVTWRRRCSKYVRTSTALQQAALVRRAEVHRVQQVVECSVGEALDRGGSHASVGQTAVIAEVVVIGDHQEAVRTQGRPPVHAVQELSGHHDVRFGVFPSRPLTQPVDVDTLEAEPRGVRGDEFDGALAGPCADADGGGSPVVLAVKHRRPWNSSCSGTACGWSARSCAWSWSRSLACLSLNQSLQTLSHLSLRADPGGRGTSGRQRRR